jgi:hypothetical protein
LRYVLLTITLVFIAGMGVLTADDIASNGLDVINLLGVIVLVLFATGIVGALTHRPPPRK